MFSEYAFGGAVFAGKAYASPAETQREQLAHALGECTHHGDWKTGIAIRVMEHGHGTYGYPTFRHWPSYRSLLHQQMYIDWVYRAYRHGLRLMVLVITNSEALCRRVRRADGAPCNDQDVARMQIAAVHRMLDSIRNQEGGWVELAHSADEARSIIEDNRLALTLGIEVDSLFGCEHPGEPSCLPASYATELDWLYESGVRQVTPIHLVDNGFGGAAFYDELLNVSQAALRGAPFYPDPEGCLDEAVDYEFRGGFANWALARLVAGVSYRPEYPRLGGHCNARGLTSAGERFVGELMARGMIVDVEHMSEKSFWRTVEIASTTGAPLVSSHAWLREIKLPIGDDDVRSLNRDDAAQIRAEMHRSDEMLVAISRLGGLVGLITNHGRVRDRVGEDQECPETSESVAIALSHAVEVMGEAGVALGTDFNGLAGQPAPRFGEDSCRAGAALEYPFADHQGVGTSCVRVGERDFDFNYDGLAHYGLVPDLIADLELVGASRNEVDRLFRSADDYVRSWERAERAVSFPAPE